MLGTNRDLETLRDLIDSEIATLRDLARDPAGQDWASRRLSALVRERLSISAVLSNRRIEAAKPVVVLSRWLTGNGLLGTAEG